MTFVSFEGVKRVEWLDASPSVYAAPDGVERGFRPDCGSTISFARPDRTETSVLAGSLDDPDAISPMQHIVTERQCAWLRIYDDLPRHVRFPPRAADRDTDIGIS